MCCVLCSPCRCDIMSMTPSVTTAQVWLLQWHGCDTHTCKLIHACGFSLCVIAGSISFKRVKFNTKLEHEKINNYKVLQSAFGKMGVDKVSVLWSIVRYRFSARLTLLRQISTWRRLQCHMLHLPMSTVISVLCSACCVCTWCYVVFCL